MSVSVGIDVAEARKGLDIVAMDADRRVVFCLAGAALSDVLDVVNRFVPDVVAIDSPPAWGRGARSRSAERELRTLGITAFSTPPDPGDHPFYRWMQVGFAVFDAVADRYPRFRGGQVRGTAIEVFPEASAVLLAAGLRRSDEPKPRFRRRVLEEAGVETAELRSIDALDAALAALTGVRSLEGAFTTVGEPDEGVIVLPVNSLPAEPLRRHSSAGKSAPAPPLTTPDQRCGCGCGAPVRRRFLPGHDAKLKSRLLRRRADGLAATRELVARGWLKSSGAGEEGGQPGV